MSERSSLLGNKNRNSCGCVLSSGSEIVCRGIRGIHDIQRFVAVSWTDPIVPEVDSLDHGLRQALGRRQGNTQTKRAQCDPKYEYS